MVVPSDDLVVRHAGHRYVRKMERPTMLCFGIIKEAVRLVNIHGQFLDISVNVQSLETISEN